MSSLLSTLAIATASTAGPSFSLDLGGIGEPSGMSSLVKIAIVMTVLAILPSVLVMFTCFVRLIVVFHLLRQALGTQTVPPNHVLIGLALMLTFFVMGPVAQQVYDDGVLPYQEGTLDGEQALEAGLTPVKEWMLRNTRRSDLMLFVRISGTQQPIARSEVPLNVLMPAFLISELKTSFQIGFLLFMPFLVIDLVVASVLLSMGMMMLPPVMISFPFKILLFVMVDGWALLISSLVSSFH